MFEHFKRVSIQKRSHIGYQRFKHYQIYQVMLPYSNFVLSAVSIYLLFLVFDYQHLEDDFSTAVFIRTTLSALCFAMMLWFKRHKPKLLNFAEFSLILVVYWSILYIGQLAIDVGDFNYQLGGTLVLVYVGALSRLPFHYSFCALTAMLIIYLVMIAPERIAHDFDGEVDRISIMVGLFFIATISSLRRDFETWKAYEQYRQIRSQRLRLQASQKSLAEQTITDPLTGLKNRLYFSQHAFDAERYACRHGLTYAALMIDIDNFKQINDLYGHQVGDKVISQVGDVIQSYCGNLTDMNIRYGGEEFLVVFLRIDKDTLEQIAADILRSVVELPWRDTGLDVTVSIGAAFANAKQTPLKKLVNLADMALYRAKNEGKNCLRY
ncbi:GGDEF domain-containing protein [Shewanella maritima]|uniref:diguanylate cyclase n=1 Tax=Shewanella maritima TaxID=2520507 RepID=A0A411PFM1_9GAMM|nr:GGDEF domain-containing protein [Shewanella maritima]QBF82351.1 GGDEF domain-containing protein [Shewanella maritima]